MMENIWDRETELRRHVQLLDLAREGVFICDMSGTFTFWNRGAEQIYGWTKKEVIGRHSHELLRTKFPKPFSEIEAELLHVGYWSGELIYTRRDGHELIVESRWALQRDQRGEPVGILEINNDITERRRTEDALRLQDAIVRNMAEGVCLTRASDATIIYANPTFEKMFGYKSGGLNDRHVTVLNYPNSDKSPEQVAHDIIDELNTQQAGHYEIQNVRADGTAFWCRAHISTFDHPEHGRIWISVHEDISERKAAEVKLQDETAVVHLLWAVATAANEASNLEGALQACLDQVCIYTGWPVGHAYRVNAGSTQELISTRIWHLNVPAHFEAFRKATEAMSFGPGIGLPGQILTSGEPFWSDNIVNDPVFLRGATASEVGLRAAVGFPVRADDEVAAVLEFFSPDAIQPKERLLEAMALVGAQVGRVIERLRTEAALRQFSARVLKAQDEERRRIARELHDSTGQNLAALSMLLAKPVEGGSTLHYELRRLLGECRKLVQVCSHDIRTLSYLLHPPLMDERGLPSALRWFAEGFTKRSGIQIHLEVSSDMPRLPQEIEMAMFRIVQESLTNTHRHSESSTATIRLGVNRNEVQLEVRDNGKGLSKPRIGGRVTALGVGITGMSERVKELNGQMNIESDACGTSVRVTLPLEATAA
jgi:PAS domain S-box-containing protein